MKKSSCSSFKSFSIGPFQYNDLVKQLATPFYVYDAQKITQQYQTLKDALSDHINKPTHVRYAIKANSNLAILNIFQKLGAGAEVVSQGELLRALKGNIPPSRIVFSGIGKTEEEITLAIQTGIEQLSVESLEELEKVADIAWQLKRGIPICLRVNPNIEASTHAKITTGLNTSKFGIPLTQITEACQLLSKSNFLDFLGLSVHIGSQIQSAEPYKQTFQIIKELALNLSSQGYSLKRLDLGGGFSVPYSCDVLPFDLATYAKSLNEAFNNLPYELTIEPGRYLVAEAGFLLTKILYIKRTPERTFIIVDAAMNDMMRPALYDATHSIIPCSNETNSDEQELVDIVGPVCESSDYFAKQILMPTTLKVGDILAITNTGAYGASLSSTYNTRALIPELLVDNNQLYLIRERIEPEQFLTFETPKRLI